MVTEPTSSVDLSPSTAALPPSELSFSSLPLSAELERALEEMGYLVPTPVQLAVWEPAVAGNDVVVQARTGTGKTAAFGMPIVDRLVRRSTAAVQALVLCPTRELALQVTRELDQLGKHKQVSTVAVYGGAPMGRQIDALASGTPIVVGTPGRVLDHLKRGTLDPSAIRLLVLDESDEMLSMGFEKELSAIVDRLPPGRQTLLFSATLPPDIERIVRTKLRDPQFLLLSGDHIGALEVAHFFYLVSHDKPGTLRTILEIEDPESAVIFCNTREQTARVAQDLRRHGYSADWLNGDLPQSDREKVMAATRAGELRLLVATDVAARGIDISHLTHVINYDFPQDAEGYVHRTGRTGRAGSMGTAVSLVTAQEVGALYVLRLTYGIRPMERQLPTAREQQTRRETDVINAMALALPDSAAAGTEARALARRLLTHDAAETVLAGLIGHFLGARGDFEGKAATRRREARPRPVPPPSPRPARPAPRVAPEREPAQEAPRGAVAATPTPVEPEPRRAVEPEPRRAVEPEPRRAVEPEPRRAVEPEPRRAVEPEGAVEMAFVELYVNVGRKEGVRTRDLRGLLHDDGGLPHEDVGRVRVRDRCSFVEVVPDRVAEAIRLLERGNFEGRAVQAAVSDRGAQS